MDKSIAEAVKFIDKEFAEARTPATVDVLTTGSLAVDIITGRGGFPRGRLSEIFGWEYSGKTTLALMAFAAAQRAGHYAAYVDAEKGVDTEYARKLGAVLDNDAKGLFLLPDTFEETALMVDKLAEAGVPLIIVDSVPGMVPTATMEGGIDETGRIGEMARLLASTLPRLTKTIAKHNTALVMINQMRKKVNTGWQPSFMPRESTEESSGGSALKFFAALRIDMSIVKKGLVKESEIDFFTSKPIEVSKANAHQAKIIKNKVGAPYRSCQFTIRYDEARGLYGIDNIATVIGIATSQKIIVKTGSYFKCTLPTGDNFSVQGEEALFDFVVAHPEIRDQLWAEVLKIPGVVTGLKGL